jgi:hypothetical protein
MTQPERRRSSAQIQAMTRPASALLFVLTSGLLAAACASSPEGETGAANAGTTGSSNTGETSTGGTGGSGGEQIGPEVEWTRQVGSSDRDSARSVSVDGNGNVFVAGDTSGALPGQTSAGDSDAFVRKYDSSGAEVWTHQFGSTGNDIASSVSADGSGNVFVAGDTDGTLPGQTRAGDFDAFVRKLVE